MEREQRKRERGRELENWCHAKRWKSQWHTFALLINNINRIYINTNCDVINTINANIFPKTSMIYSQSASHVRRRKPARLQTIDPWTILTICSSLISIYYTIDAIRHVNRGIIGAQNGRPRPCTEWSSLKPIEREYIYGANRIINNARC